VSGRRLHDVPISFRPARDYIAPVSPSPPAPPALAVLPGGTAALAEAGETFA
jgi:hypothetical protein